MAEIIGIGSLLADKIIEVDDAFLSTIRGQKGGMEYASVAEIDAWMESCPAKPRVAPGGSAANVMRGLAHFGRACTLVTKCGSDLLAKELAADLHAHGVEVAPIYSDQPTGQVLSLVTPDGQRTMRTHLGASAVWRAGELPPAAFKGAKLVHIEGYLLLHSGVAARAMSLAKEAGAQVSLDLSSFEVTAQHKEQILELMTEYVDVIIANEDEARMLTGCLPQRGCSLMKDICRTAVVTMGPLGCWVGHEGIMYQCPAYPVSPLDTTGAGDLFTSGFLHGYLSDLPLPECAHIGAVAGRAVVQVLGTTLPRERWEEVKLLAATPRPLALPPTLGPS